MSLFSKHTTANLDEQAQDRLGGFAVIDTDIYVGTIKMAYHLVSKDGAEAIFLELALEGGKTYSETIYITTKEGKNYYLTDNKKSAPLAGFTVINDICIVACDGEELNVQPTETKTLKIWDYEAKKELPKEVPVLTNLIDKKVAVAIWKILENKGVKGQDGKYHATAETREKNGIDKVFHPELKVTIPEIRVPLKDGEKIEDRAKFWDSWLTKNKGQVKDKREIKDGQGGPPKAGGPPAAGGQSTAEKKTLFGKK